MEHAWDSQVASTAGRRAPAPAGSASPARRHLLPAKGAHPLEPARVLDVEISRPLPAIEPGAGATGQPYRSAVVLIRLHGQPLGTLSFGLEEGGIEPAQVHGAARRARQGSVPVPPEPPDRESLLGPPAGAVAQLPGQGGVVEQEPHGVDEPAYPRQLTMSELLGALKGPIAYLRSRARARSQIRLKTLSG